jgi:hypothetical protein
MRILISLLAVSLLLSGCVTIGVNQQLYRDGTVDMSVSFSGEEKVLAGFQNITVNPSLSDKFTFTQEPGKLTYSFQGIPSGAKLFQMEPNKETSFFGIEEYTLTKEFSFPSYRYTYTLTPSNALPIDSNPQTKAIMSAIKVDYTVNTFGKIVSTNGAKIDDDTVQFTVDATSTTPYTIEFKDFFLSNWFGK